jgi:hypothetical protein
MCPSVRFSIASIGFQFSVFSCELDRERPKLHLLSVIYFLHIDTNNKFRHKKYKNSSILIHHLMYVDKNERSKNSLADVPKCDIFDCFHFRNFYTIKLL